MTEYNPEKIKKDVIALIERDKPQSYEAWLNTLQYIATLLGERHDIYKPMIPTSQLANILVETCIHNQRKS